MNIRTLAAATLAVGALGALTLTAGADSAAKLPAGQLDQVAAIVTGAGYTFEEAEIEGGKIEADATKDGVEWELVVDLDTGSIISAEQDD